MARKRNNKKRQDFRQGGRVQLAAGNQPNKIKEPRGRPNLPYTPAPVIQKKDPVKQKPPMQYIGEGAPQEIKKDPVKQKPPMQYIGEGAPSPSVTTPNPLPKEILRDPAPAPEKERPQTTYATEDFPRDIQKVSNLAQGFITGKTPTTSSSYIPPDERATQTQYEDDYDGIGAGLPQFPKRATEGTTYTWTNPTGEVMNFIYTNGSWGLAGTDTGGGDGGGDGDNTEDKLLALSGWLAENPSYGLGTNWQNYKTGTGGRTEDQAQEVRNIVQMAADGTLPKDAKIPSPAELEASINFNKEDIPQMGDTTAATAGVAEGVGYDAAGGTQTDATVQQNIGASTYGADTTGSATIDPATGNISEEATAEMQNQALTLAAKGVGFTDEQKTRGLTDRVVGTISPEAMANAAKVAGTDLPRLLRAKKQLRRAGLSEEQINLIGTDPDLLEDELGNYTEAQRGMIAGLPEEALVSTQLNSLLEGMESGEIPAFARPAVAAVNEMLAQRGLDVSTVGRDALFNAIIQTATPLAQSNAQSIKESVLSQRGIEAQAEQMNAQMRQQTGLANASNVFNMNMAQFTADQQTALSNSKFLQTTSLTEVANDQQAIVQNAASMAQLDLATLDSNTKLAAQNAQAFLQMDMANLSNEQQASVLNGQMTQQSLLSNQAAANASKQFNATSENQTNQFMANLAQQTEQFNKQQSNAMSQFNATQKNAASALAAQSQAEANKLNASMATQISQYTAGQEFAREQFNTQNSVAIEQANVAWRRQANTVNTAALNAVNQQNAQNALGLSTQAMSFLWQELRDQMDYSFKAFDNDQQRKASLMVAALGNEGASYEGKNWSTNLQGMTAIMKTFLGG